MTASQDTDCAEAGISICCIAEADRTAALAIFDRNLMFPLKTLRPPTIKGRVENATAHSKVRVELVYPKEEPGEAGEVALRETPMEESPLPNDSPALDLAHR